MRLNLTYEQLHTRDGMLDEILESLFDAAILVDQNGIILYNSSGSLAMRNLKKDEVLGLSHNLVHPKTLFPIVLETGKARLGLVDVIGGRKCITNIYPIFDGSRIIGALGTVLFRNLNALKDVIANIQNDKDINAGELYNTLARIGTSYTFQDYVGNAPATLRLLEQCKKVAATNRAVLLIGETGTGKEILAGAIHSAKGSGGWNPFVKVNCSAIPNELLESELFGHEKGAFTGATALKKGKFELAAGGSILLDEIGDMQLQMQSKLLRVLEEREFERIGGTKMIPMTARVIASTNADLRTEAIAGSFRPDLYYRLSALEIRVPSLRERIEDVPLLVEHFIKRDQLQVEFTSEALDAIMSYHWPGNIRELRNVINRLDIMCAHKTICRTDVQTVLDDCLRTAPLTAPEKPEQAPQPPAGPSEAQELLAALERNNYNLTKTAKDLGVCRATLYNRMNRHGVSTKRSAT